MKQNLTCGSYSTSAATLVTCKQQYSIFAKL